MIEFVEQWKAEKVTHITWVDDQSVRWMENWAGDLIEVAPGYTLEGYGPGGLFIGSNFKFSAGELFTTTGERRLFGREADAVGILGRIDLIDGVTIHIEADSVAQLSMPQMAILEAMVARLRELPP